MTHSRDAAHPAHERGRHIAARLRNILLPVLMIGCAGLWYWKTSTDEVVREHYRDLLARDQARAVAAATTQVDAALKAAATALAAGATEPMRQGDFESIRRMFARVQRSPRVVEVTLMRNDGKIMVSSLQAKATGSYSNMFRNATAALKDAFVTRDENGAIFAMCPIRSDGITLGLAIIRYRDEVGEVAQDTAQGAPPASGATGGGGVAQPAH
jgi:hypothetical protein